MSILARRATTGARREPADARVGALFDEHAPMVLAICRYLLRDPQAAEDAAQETFLAAHRSLLRGTEPHDPPAWLATIARNECRRVWRTTRTRSLDERTTATTLDPADIVAERADLNEVADAIGKLPPRQREALVLREFCGLSYSQVAAAMSVSLPVVDSLLSRARRGLIERVGHIPRAARGALVVPVSLREELARLIPGLEPAGAGTTAGLGGIATVTGLASGPVAAKVAATTVAAVALALPVQATLRSESPRPDVARQPAPEKRATARPSAPPARARTAAAVAVAPPPPARPAPSPPSPPPRTKRVDNSGPGSHREGESVRHENSGTGPAPSTGSSGPGPAPEPSPTVPSADSSGPGPSGPAPAPVAVTTAPDNSGPGSSSSGSGSDGSGSSGSGSDSSGSSGSGSSGSGSDSSGSSGSESSGSGSDSSDSGSSGSGESGSGSGGSGSGEPVDD